MNKKVDMILRTRQGKKAMLRYYATKQRELEKQTLLRKLLSFLKRKPRYQSKVEPDNETLRESGTVRMRK